MVTSLESNSQPSLTHAETQIYSTIMGKGAPLVMLHGWGQSGANLKTLAQLLSVYFQIHVLDLPGFGKSPMPPSVCGTEEYAQMVLGYLNAQGIEDAYFFGHSFGGQTCLRIAAGAPDRVRKLVLVASAGLPRQRPLFSSIRFLAIRWLGRSTKIIDTVFHTRLYETYFIPRFSSDDYKQAGSMRPIFLRAVNEDVSPAARSVHCPTLLLWGERDEATPLYMARKLNELIADSRLVVLPRRGHNFLESIEAHLCAFYIRNFLNNQERPGVR